MIPFPLNENRFSLFCCRPFTSWPVLYKSQERWEPSIMSESDIMFNKRDRRYATVQLMLSTDPSHVNRTIASTLKMQIWIATNNRDVPRVMKTKFSATVVVFGVVSSEATSCHLTSSKSAWKLTSKCIWMCWRVWWCPSAIRWPVADPECGSRTWRRPTSSKRPRLGFRKSATTLYPSLTGPPPYPTWTRWTTSFGHTSRTSPIWPPTTPKPSSAEYSPSSRRRLCKRHAPSSRSVSRWWLKLKAVTLYTCQLYYIIKLPELIFSIKF